MVMPEIIHLIISGFYVQIATVLLLHGKEEIKEVVEQLEDFH